MAKYYVTSGDFSLIVTAQDAEGAALWSLHMALARGDCSRQPSPATRLGGSEWPVETRVENPLVDWGQTIQISEIGFGRSECGTFGTVPTLKHYCQLLAAIEKICDLLPPANSRDSNSGR